MNGLFKLISAASVVQEFAVALTLQDTLAVELSGGVSQIPSPLVKQLVFVHPPENVWKRSK